MAENGPKNLIIVIDVTDPDANIEAVRNYITSNTDILNWWNHIPGTYIVQTGLAPEELSDRLKPFTQDARFLVMEANPSMSEGWLPERAWRWLRRRSREFSAAAE